jgi:REP element-mobilizing transposase RayT
MLSCCAVAFELTHDPFRYRRRLPHIQNAFSYFVSFHCQGDLTLPEDTRTPVLETILKEAERTITLYAATIMPNHAHMLFSIRPLQPEPVLYRILQTIKRISAWKVNRVLGRAGELWQPESFDRMLRTNKDEFEHYYTYIAENAVKAGLAATPEEYRWFWHFDRNL